MKLSYLNEKRIMVSKNGTTMAKLPLPYGQSKTFPSRYAHSSKGGSKITAKPDPYPAAPDQTRNAAAPDGTAAAEANPKRAKFFGLNQPGRQCSLPQDMA